MRLASSVAIGFPYESKRVCWIVVEDGVPSQASSQEEKRKAVRLALAGELKLFAVWPGDWSSDLFELDDLAAAAESLGMTVDA